MLKQYFKSIIVLIILVGCGTDRPPKEETAPKAPPKAVSTTDAGIPEEELEPPPPPPSGRKVVAYRDGVKEEMREPQALAKGLTVVDLSNFWVPFIFSEKDTPDGVRLKNDFRPVFRKLANDWPYESQTVAAARKIVERHKSRVLAARMHTLREEGVSEEDIRERLGLPDPKESKGRDGGSKKEKDAGAEDKDKDKEDEDSFKGGLGEATNYLEVYGIPPSLSVLRKRALTEIDKPCFDDIDFDAIGRFDGFIAYKSKAVARAEAKKGRPFAKKMRREMERLGISDPLELTRHPNSKASGGLVRMAVRFEAMAESQKLLVCEGFYPKGEENNYWSGGLDWKTHQAFLAFERKNRIFGWGFFGKDTRYALSRTSKERLFDSFLRVISERIIDATGIIEDGSAVGPDGKKAVYKDKDGQDHDVRNLVAEFAAAALRHMDLGTPEKVVDFLKRNDDKAFDALFVALPLPQLPPYYHEEMDLFAVIDRGDVWYDYPYTEDGKRKSQPRKNMPTTSLYVKWNDQEIPLVSMNTTIGGWRTEQASDGYEYFKYKNSDVGLRVWKDIVAGPVWLPPDTTPRKDLVKDVIYRKRKITVPNYDEFGPWYASAYGLVAAFHVRRVERKSGAIAFFDNGIRSHGSVDYNSILRRFSHGCHRLYNHLAIRIFDFVLKHKDYTRVGQVPAGYSRKFTIPEEDAKEGDEGETFIININSKGYKYELKEPVPINVRSGRIRGKQKTPIEHYMPKPGVEYGPEAEFLPEAYRKKSDAGSGPPQSGDALPTPGTAAQTP